MQESKRTVVVGGALAAVIAIGLGIYFWPKSDGDSRAVAPTAEPAKPDAAANYPVPPPKSDAPPLPPLEDSDSLFADTVSALFGADAVQNLLVKTDVARHLVVTIDNLPRKKVAERLKPINPIPGKFSVAGAEGSQTIAPENAARYSSAIRMLTSVDSKALAAAYFKTYPLLQQAYVDLGYPNGYFNNRLVEVIDHLLATPDVKGPLKVTQPNVLYEYADPQLEALSAGQKTLLRMGPENAAKVKAKLTELRAIVTAKPPGEPAAK